MKSGKRPSLLQILGALLIVLLLFSAPFWFGPVVMFVIVYGVLLGALILPIALLFLRETKKTDHWSILLVVIKLPALLFTGFMLAAVGTIGIPQIYTCLTPFVCPDDYELKSHIGQERPYSGKTITFTVPECVQDEDVLQVNRWYVFFLLVGIYVIAGLLLQGAGIALDHIHFIKQSYLHAALGVFVFFCLMLVLGYSGLLEKTAAQINHFIPKDSFHQKGQTGPQADDSPKSNESITAKTNYSAGEHVQVLWGGKWWNAKVLKAKKGRWLIQYDGYDESWNEWVGKDRMRAVFPAPEVPDAR